MSSIFKLEITLLSIFVAIPPQKKSRKQKKTSKHDRNSNKRPINSRSPNSNSKAIIISDNSDRGKGSDGKLKFVISGKIDKEKSIMIYLDQPGGPEQIANPRRKVSFASPKNNFIFYNPKNALAKPLWIESPTFRGSPTSIDISPKPLKISPPKTKFI